MILALDTNVFVDLIRGRSPRVRRRHDQAAVTHGPLVASLIVYHELKFGIASSRDPISALLVTDDVLRDIIIEPLSEDDVTVAAQIRATLKRLGTPIGPYDALIAGQALARDWTLVTSNVLEFERVEGLRIENWAA